MSSSTQKRREVSIVGSRRTMVVAAYNRVPLLRVAGSVRLPKSRNCSTLARVSGARWGSAGVCAYSKRGRQSRSSCRRLERRRREKVVISKSERTFHKIRDDHVVLSKCLDRAYLRASRRVGFVAGHFGRRGQGGNRDWDGRCSTRKSGAEGGRLSQWAYIEEGS